VVALTTLANTCCRASLITAMHVLISRVSPIRDYTKQTSRGFSPSCIIYHLTNEQRDCPGLLSILMCIRRRLPS